MAFYFIDSVRLTVTACVQLQLVGLAGTMFSVMFFVLMLNAFSVEGQDLFNLDCSSSIDCIQFQIAGSPNVTCTDSQCKCLDLNHQEVSCKPRENKFSNIIGGKCPCSIENSECNDIEDVCYCLKDFTAIHQKRACVKGMLVSCFLSVKTLTTFLYRIGGARRSL